MKHSWLVGLWMCWAANAFGSDAVRPGELTIEHPTLISLGFEWQIEGDANGNATCKVQYRQQGDSAWREYLPLYRIGLGLDVPLAMICGWPRCTVPDALAGSIMDLTPGTEYEVKLQLRDPDGIEGDGEKILSLRTRPEPRLPDEPVEVRHVYPPNYQGSKEKPNYRGIMHAINGFAPMADCYQTIHPNVAKPGTVVKVHAGVYTPFRNKYFWKAGSPTQYWLHGIMTLLASGTKEHPIYVVGAGDGEVVIDGDGAHTVFNVRSADYLHFEGLTIKNAEIAIFGGFQGERGGGCRGLTVKNCWIENVVYGVLAQDGRSDGFVIADNVILGCNPSDRFNFFGSTRAGYAVNLAGQGHTVCHNFAANFWDGINVFTSSLSDPQYDQQSRAIDFYNNDIHNCSDQFIEADGGYANIRILRNRCFNCPSQPLSTQPVHAGPVYWIRNIVWNACGGRMAMKNNDGAQVYVFLHNTSSTHMKMPPNAGKPPEKCTWIIQNNLSIGPGGTDLPLTAYCAGVSEPRHVVSHNAYNKDAANATCKVGEKDFTSLHAMHKATGFDRESLFVDGYNVFQDAPEPPHAKRGTGLILATSVDLRLKPQAEPVDAGVPLPGINDDFTGDAPDVGAYEMDRPLPVYGPRGGQYLDRLNDLRHGRYIPVTPKDKPKEHQK